MEILEVLLTPPHSVDEKRHSIELELEIRGRCSEESPCASFFVRRNTRFLTRRGGSGRSGSPSSEEPGTSPRIWTAGSRRPASRSRPPMSPGKGSRSSAPARGCCYPAARRSGSRLGPRRRRSPTTRPKRTGPRRSGKKLSKRTRRTPPKETSSSSRRHTEPYRRINRTHVVANVGFRSAVPEQTQRRPNVLQSGTQKTWV